MARINRQHLIKVAANALPYDCCGQKKKPRKQNQKIVGVKSAERFHPDVNPENKKQKTNGGPTPYDTLWNVSV